MYKTLTQLFLLLVLVIIIFSISKKYFYNEDQINEENNTTSLNIKENNTSNKNLEKKSVDNEIINLTYEKFDTNGNKYLINAKKGVLDNENPNIIYMSVIEASLIYLNNERVIISSEEAIFNKENFKTTFSKNVKLTYQEQILKSDKLEFLLDKNIAIFSDNVKYYNQNIEAFSDVVIINLLTKEIDIKSKNQKKIRIKKKN
tara:strand:+ start:380 stop:985 length:606 start_codon:yes stop_codon:yes gene_type:complete